MTAGASRSCPTLVTPRLTLGAHRLEDYEDSVAMWSDPTVMRYMGGEPSTAEDVWSRQLRYAGLWPLLGYGYWRITETATGRFVGEAGLAEFRRDLTPSQFGTPEGGWALAAWAHRRGFAREATAAIFNWADRVLGAPRTVCMIDPANAPSLALAAALGFSPFARTVYKGRESVLLERFAAPAECEA